MAIYHIQIAVFLPSPIIVHRETGLFKTSQCQSCFIVMAVCSVPMRITRCVCAAYVRYWSSLYFVPFVADGTLHVVCSLSFRVRALHNAPVTSHPRAPYGLFPGCFEQKSYVHSRAPCGAVRSLNAWIISLRAPYGFWYPKHPMNSLCGDR